MDLFATRLNCQLPTLSAGDKQSDGGDTPFPTCPDQQSAEENAWGEVKTPPHLEILSMASSSVVPAGELPHPSPLLMSLSSCMDTIKEGTLQHNYCSLAGAEVPTQPTSQLLYHKENWFPFTLCAILPKLPRFEINTITSDKQSESPCGSTHGSCICVRGCTTLPQLLECSPQEQWCVKSSHIIVYLGWGDLPQVPLPSRGIDTATFKEHSVWGLPVQQQLRREFWFKTYTRKQIGADIKYPLYY